MGLAEPDRLDRVRALLEKLGVPVKLPADMDEDTVIDLLKHDKKAVDKWPKFVLITRLGQVHHPDGQYAVDVDRKVVEKVLKSMTDG
jgi:3-dehydroquinate synthetase